MIHVDEPAKPGGSWRAGCLVASLVALALTGCGDDEGGVEQDARRSGTATGPATVTSPTTATAPAMPGATAPAPPAQTTAPERERRFTVPEDALTNPPSEDGPGGAGDEQPASSQALFTGRGGRLRPRLVQVPAFIAIRVELRSADGRAYRLRFGRRSIRVGRGRRSAALTFDGLRPGRRMVGIGSGRVVISASAEPGP